MALLMAGSLALAASPAIPPAPRLPAEVAAALHSAAKGTLYSLEPTQKPVAGDAVLHGYKVLGQMELDPRQAAIAVRAFEDAMALGDQTGASLCMIAPRHALSFVADGHVYDFLLCFQCDQLAVYKDNQQVAFMNVGGSSEVLNNLLTSAKVPLSQSGLADDARKALARNAAADARTRWRRAAPQSLQPLLTPMALQQPEPPDVAPLRAPLAAEFPEVTPRIRALLAWYGAGSKDWLNVPFYEGAALALLQDYSTAEVVAAIQTAPLSDDQKNGAARALTSYKPAHPVRGSQPAFNYDAAAIPPAVKAMLLEYVLQGGNKYNMLFAQQIFAPPAKTEPASP